MLRWGTIAALILVALALAAWILLGTSRSAGSGARRPDAARSEPASRVSPSLAEAPPPEQRTQPRTEGGRTPALPESVGRGELVLYLRVLRAPGGEPIGDAVFTAASPRGAALVRALTADGRPPLAGVRPHELGLFELRLDPVLTAAICVRAPGCAARAMLVEGGHERPEDAATVILERPSAIAARLSGGPSHDLDGARLRVRTPVRGLVVEVPDSEAPDLAEASWTVESDALGHAELAGLPARVPLDLSVERGGVCVHRHAEPVVLEPGEVRELELVLGAASVVLGRMIDEHDAPLSGREVWLVEVDPRFLDAFDPGTRPLERATTGPDGTFRFDAVREGRWRIGPAFVPRDAAGDEEPIRADVVRIDVGARSERIEVTLRALRGSFVSGVVIDEEEQPVANCVVQVDPSSASRTWTRSDARGEFRVGPLGSGVHQLVAGSAGAGTWSESPPLDVLAGTRGVVLRVTLGAALRGRLVGADGREQAGGRIEVTQVEAGEAAAAWAMTVNRARFDLAGLSAGTYDVLVVARGALACSARVELRAGEQREIELRLEAGATLALENQANEDFTVELRAEGRLVGLHPLARASSRRWTVPAGTLEVRYRDAEQRPLATQALELRPGEERTLVHPPR